MGLSYYQEELFVANAQVDQPSILVLHGSRGVMLRRIVSDALLPSPSRNRRVGNELFVSCSNHTIVKLSLSDTRNQMALHCAEGNASGSQDGVVSSARLHSPHGLVNMGSSLVACDTGNRSVRVISNGNNSRNFQLLYIRMLSFLTLITIEEFLGRVLPSHSQKSTSL